MDVKFNNTVLNNNFTYGRVSAEGAAGNDVSVFYFTNGFVLFTGIVNIITNGNAGTYESSTELNIKFPDNIGIISIIPHVSVKNAFCYITMERGYYRSKFGLTLTAPSNSINTFIYFVGFGFDRNYEIDSSSSGGSDSGSGDSGSGGNQGGSSSGGSSEDTQHGGVSSTGYGYTKYNDGTLVCTGSVLIQNSSSQLNTQYATFDVDTNANFISTDYTVTFKFDDIDIVDNTISTSNKNYNWFTINVRGYNTLYLNKTLHWTATGKWK